MGRNPPTSFKPLLGVTAVVVAALAGCKSIDAIHIPGRPGFDILCRNYDDCPERSRVRASELCSTGFVPVDKPHQSSMGLLLKVRCQQTNTVKLEFQGLKLADRSVHSPGRVSECRSAIVLEPSQSADETPIAQGLAERELMTAGIKVVSVAVTARIVEQNENGHYARVRLSPVERAVTLGRETNADCVVQISNLSLIDHSRYFAWDGSSPTMVEVSAADYTIHPSYRRKEVTVPRYSLSAKVIRVEDADILAAIELDSGYPSPSYAWPLQAVNGLLPGHESIRLPTVVHAIGPMLHEFARHVRGLSKDISSLAHPGDQPH